MIAPLISMHGIAPARRAIYANFTGVILWQLGTNILPLACMIGESFIMITITLKAGQGMGGSDTTPASAERVKKSAGSNTVSVDSECHSVTPGESAPHHYPMSLNTKPGTAMIVTIEPPGTTAPVASIEL